MLSRNGRPKETVENVTAPDDSIDIASMTREQRDALKRELLRQHPELAERFTGIRASTSHHSYPCDRERHSGAPDRGLKRELLRKHPELVERIAGHPRKAMNLRAESVDAR